MAPPGDRLESWKEIATFLNKGVRTVQRWERTEGLPVHRHMHDRLGTVYAYRPELEAWWANRSASLSGEAAAAPPLARRKIRWEWAAASAVVILAIAGWKLTAEAGPEIRLGEGIPFTSSPAFEFQPAFSPDGRFVVYGVSDGKLPGDLYLQSVGRGEPERLTTSPMYEVSPSWSPDGQHIGYMRGEGKAAAELIVQPSVRGTERKVADIRYHGQGLPLMTWSADSQWLIAADKPDETTRAGLFRFHIVSGERQRLTTTCDSCAADSSLSRSPDGSEIVFLRVLEDGRRDLWLLSVSRDGSARGEPRRLTHLNAHIGVPVWLPGGRDIAFPLLNDFSWRWQRISRSGPVSYASMHDFDTLARIRPRAVFSPDGRYLIASDDTEDHNIRRLDLSTGEERDLIVSTRIETNAQISPDGTQIAFPSSRRGNIEIWKAGSDGSNAVQLTSVPGKSAGTPRWSPDGKQIAFDIADSRNSDVWVMNSDGGQMRRLTDHPARDFVPSWSRDGQWIYFGSDREGTEIWKVPVSGGDPGARDEERRLWRLGIARWDVPLRGEERRRERCARTGRTLALAAVGRV